MRTRRRATDDAGFSEADEPVFKIPHDPYNEAVVLGSAVADRRARKKVLSRAKVGQFLGKGHGAIFEALRDADRRGLDVDALTIKQLGGKAVDQRALDRVFDIAARGAAPNITHFLATLDWDAARARTIDGPVGELLRALADQRGDPERAVALSRQITLALEGHGARDYTFDSDTLVDMQMAEIRARKTGNAVYPYGIKGLDEYDDGSPLMVPGAAPKLITIISSLSGSGKSTLMALIALGIARQRRRVLFGAWEDPAGITMEHLGIYSLAYSKRRFAIGESTDDEDDTLEERMRKIGRWVKFFKFPWGGSMGEKPTSNDEVVDKIHGYIADSGCEVVMLDLLQDSFVDTRPDKEKSALHALRQVTDDTKTHLVAAHQQNLKDTERRLNTQPTRAGLKGSSGWVDKADNIIAPHWPAKWKKVPNNVLQIFVLKQKRGVWPLGIEFDWDPDAAHLDNPRQFDVTAGAANDGDEGPIKAWLKEDES